MALRGGVPMSLSSPVMAWNRGGFRRHWLEADGGPALCAEAADELFGQVVTFWRIDADAAQRAGDEVVFGVGVGVAVAGVLAGELLLQVRVAGAKARIGPERVPEGDQRAGVRLVVLDHVQEIGAGLWPRAQEPDRKSTRLNSS